jgi:glycogen(starch) synthase
MPPARRTALWVVPVSDLGGVARHVLDVVRVGIPGWRVVVLCPPGPLVTKLTEAGGAVLACEFGPAAGFRASAASLRHAIRALRPEVVHSHLSYADIVVAAAAPRSVRLVTTEHGIAADDAVYHRSQVEARVMAGVHRARLRRFDRAIAVSQATSRAMRDKWGAGDGILVIPNGVDRPSPRACGTAGLRFLSLSRLAPEKRIDDLVSAFGLVVAAHPDATLTIAGAGSLEQQLRRQVDELGISTHVTFPGFVPTYEALAGADVVVQLSTWENCSYTLLDAVTHGLGVVASPVGGNPEMLPGTRLVDPADHRSVASRMVSQGCNLDQRPELSDTWPSTAMMTSRIARVYVELAA